MKRLLAVLLILAAPAAFAFDTRSHSGPLRLGLLETVDLWSAPRDVETSARIRENLIGELRAAGFDAFAVRNRFDDLRRDDSPPVDYYVEILGSTSATRPVGGVSVGGPDLVVDVGLAVSHVAASIRLYDARTLDVLGTFALQKRDTAILPTGIGIGHDFFSAYVAAPIVRWTSYRAATRDVAHQAASLISGAVRH